ncbi:MAG: hypothetical protein NVSMB9_23110 [Isosphaeraceae bacterium]
MHLLHLAIVLIGVADFAAASDCGSNIPLINGVWATTSVTIDGHRVPDDPTDGPSLLAFDKESYVQRVGSRIVDEGTYKVDAGKSYRTIDLHLKTGPEAGKRQLGIYRIEGETLTLCLASPGEEKRPRDFEEKGGMIHVIIVSRRFTP